MLERLIAFDTTSSRSNLEFVRFVADYLGRWQVPVRLSRSDDGTKANILASVGPDVPGGVVLSGHIDVVPVEGQDWRTPPFELTSRDGRLFGRGTADMKSFIAVALALVPDFIDAGLRAPIHLALSYDEEIGCFGVPRLLDDLHRNVAKPSAVIVGEPSGMRIVNAHKGVRIYRTTVTGHEAHSSLPDEGVSAVMHAASLIAFLGEIEQSLRERGAGPDGVDQAFDPPYSTLNVGRVDGGISQNVIARECVFDWEIRTLPWQDPDEIEDRFRNHVEDDVIPTMRQIFAGSSVVTDRICDVPGLRPDPESPAESLCVCLLGNNATYSVPFGSEAGIFQRAELPTVICGPGEIAQAHRPDEYIEISQIEACEDFMRKLAKWLAGRMD